MGWKPQQSDDLVTPIPLYYSFLKHPISMYGPSERVVYHGPRYQNSFHLHRKYSSEKESYLFQFPKTYFASNPAVFEDMFFMNKRSEYNRDLEAPLGDFQAMSDSSDESEGENSGEKDRRAFQGMNPDPRVEQELVFNSDFESGNLDMVVKTREGSYDLFLRVDTNSKGHMQWFYFQVKNKYKGKKVKFNIVNFTHNESLYTQGMKVNVWSYKRNIPKYVGWRRGGRNAKYGPSKVSRTPYDQKFRRFYSLSFEYTFEYEEDSVYFAYGIPYTYSMLTHYIKYLNHKYGKNKKKSEDVKDELIRSRVLCKSLSGVDIPLLTITNFPEHYQEEQEQSEEKKANSPLRSPRKSPTGLESFEMRLRNNQNSIMLEKTEECGLLSQIELKKSEAQDIMNSRKVVVLTARIHPGETTCSWILHGFMEFILSNDPIAVFLRQRLIFLIVPMLNPDGVIAGNSRGDLIGNDLNRCFNAKNLDPKLVPMNVGIQQLIQQILEKANIHEQAKQSGTGLQHKYQSGGGYGHFPTNLNLSVSQGIYSSHGKIMAYFDLHGHSRKKSTFIYGPYYPLHSNNYLKIRVMAKLLSDLTEMFRFYSCKFKNEQYKQNCGRLTIWRRFRVMNSFTLEASMHGFIQQISKTTRNGVGLEQIERKRITRPFKEKNLMSLGRKLGEMFHEYYELMEQERKRRELRAHEVKHKRKKPRVLDFLRKNQKLAQRGRESSPPAPPPPAQKEEKKIEKKLTIRSEGQKSTQEVSEKSMSSSQSGEEEEDEEEMEHQSESDSEGEEKRENEKEEKGKEREDQDSGEEQSESDSEYSLYLDESSESESEESEQDKREDVKRKSEKRVEGEKEEKKKPIEKPTDKKLLKRLRGMVNSEREKKKYSEDSEWNTSKYKSNATANTPLQKSIRITKKPSRTLADLLKVGRVHCQSIKNDRIKEVDEEYQESNIEDLSSGSDQEDNLNKEDLTVIQGRVLSIMNAFNNVSSDPRAALLKAAKKGKLSFEMQRDQERKARLKSKYLEDDISDSLQEVSQQKPAKQLSARRIVQNSKSRSPKSRPAKPLTVAEYIRTKVQTPSTQRNSSPAPEKIESSRKMEVVIPSVKKQDGLSNCMTIIKSHKPANSQQIRYNQRKLQIIRASSTNVTPKAPVVAAKDQIQLQSESVIYPRSSYIAASSRKPPLPPKPSKEEERLQMRSHSIVALRKAAPESYRGPPHLQELNEQHSRFTLNESSFNYYPRPQNQNKLNVSLQYEPSYRPSTSTAFRVKVDRNSPKKAPFTHISSRQSIPATTASQFYQKMKLQQNQKEDYAELWNSKSQLPKEFRTPEKKHLNEKSNSPHHLTGEKFDPRPPSSIRKKLAARALELLVLEGESASLRQKRPAHSKFKFRSKYGGGKSITESAADTRKSKEQRDIEYNLSTEFTRSVEIKEEGRFMQNYVNPSSYLSDSRGDSGSPAHFYSYMNHNNSMIGCKDQDTLCVSNTFKNRSASHSQTSFENYERHPRPPEYERQGIRIRVGNSKDIKSVLGTFNLRHLPQAPSLQWKEKTSSKTHLLYQLKAQNAFRKKQHLENRKSTLDYSDPQLEVKGSNSRNSKRRPLLYTNLNPAMLMKLTHSVLDRQNANLSGPPSKVSTPLLSFRKK